MITGLRLTYVLLSTPFTSGLKNLSSAPLRGTNFLEMMAAGSDYSKGRRDIGTEAECSALDDSLRSWRQRLEESSKRARQIRGSNFLQLSTVDDEGKPRCRTVVFRGFQKLSPENKHSMEIDGLSCIFRMTTDFRSHKIRESRAAELVWWFPNSSEQYRVQGRLLFVGGGQFEDDSNSELAIGRNDMWNKASDASRESFLVNQLPGGIYKPEEGDIPAGGRNADGSTVPPPENFLLMLLIPDEVDYLRLTDNYRQRDMIGEGAWKGQRLNP